MRPPPTTKVSNALPGSIRHFHPHLLLLENMKVLQSHSAPQGDFQEEGDFQECLRPFLILGRLLGLLPLQNLFTRNTEITFSWKAAVPGIGILLFLVTSVVLSFIGLFRIFAENGGGNASKLAFAARDPVFYLIATFVYGFFLLRSKWLITLFSKWRRVTSDLGFKDKDKRLFFHANVATAVIFAFGTVESILFTLTNFPIMQRNLAQEASEKSHSPLETYYWRSHPFWAQVIPHLPPLTLLVLGMNILAASAWNYADIFIVLASRALYFKFKILVDQTEKRLLSRPSSSSLFHPPGPPLSWSQVRKDHLTLCKLLEEFEVFLSPLIFTSYSVNIFFICLQLHQGLTPRDDHSSLLDSAFSSVSFVFLIFRVLAISLTAAKVNEYVHLILVSIQRCATSDYSKELERLERMLASGPIGLSGLGCFVITRAFLLMVVSVIFTVEIVLLQASATPAPH